MDYTLHEWVRMASHHGSIARCAIEKQAEESGLDALAVREKMRHHLRVMQEAAQQGLDERLRSVTGLTGGQAALMMKRLQAGKCLAGNLLGKAEVYALATAECNGCMGKIVAAPTAGACGILPGAVLAMMEEKGATEEQAVDALFVAAAVGQAIATQASISGAEGGCQAEGQGKGTVHGKNLLSGCAYGRGFLRRARVRPDRPMHHPNRKVAERSSDPSLWDRAGTHPWVAPTNTRATASMARTRGRFPFGGPPFFGKRFL